MALIDQINKIECGSSGVDGTGSAACAFDWGRVVAAEITPAYYRYTDDIQS